MATVNLRSKVLGFLLPALAACTQPATSVFSEKLFRISLPGAWKQVSAQPDELHWTFQSDRNEQVTVSIFLAQTRMESPEITSTFERMLELRRESEKSQSPGVVLTEAKVSEQRNARTAYYTGVEGNDRRTADLLIVNGSGVANFYYEALGMSESAFLERARQALGSVGFVE